MYSKLARPKTIKEAIRATQREIEQPWCSTSRTAGEVITQYYVRSTAEKRLATLRYCLQVAEQ